MTAAVEVQNLGFKYNSGERQILSGVNFTVDQGELLGLIGPSGCGKSTLCMALCGAIPHRIPGVMTGSVRVLGTCTRDLPFTAVPGRVGVMLQDPETQLFLPRVRNELAFGPENLCWSRERIVRGMREVADLTGITDLLDRSPDELSGGQQQLVVLAATLALDPELLILDEVLSSLDEASVNRILNVIRQLKQRGRTIVMVDHNLKHLELADRVLVLSSGRINDVGPGTTALANPGLLHFF